MIYHRNIQVEFNHCDPAGIVFYPRYFEMTNSVVENFFAEALHYPFAEMILRDGFGVPTVRLEANFRAVSILGDILDFGLEVVRVGGSSVDLKLVAICRGQVRMTADITLVFIALSGKATRWPDGLRAALTGRVLPAAEPAKVEA